MARREHSHAGSPAPGAFAYRRLDRVLHEKARLGILTALMTRPDGIRFTDLRDLCALTDGNLSRHVGVLQDAGLVEVWKGHRRGRSRTTVRLAPAGRAQFQEYLEELERVLADARPARRPTRARHRPPGWQPA